MSQNIDGFEFYHPKKEAVAPMSRKPSPTDLDVEAYQFCQYLKQSAIPTATDLFRLDLAIDFRKAIDIIERLSARSLKD